MRLNGGLHSRRGSSKEAPQPVDLGFWCDTAFGFAAFLCFFGAFTAFCFFFGVVGFFAGFVGGGVSACTFTGAVSLALTVGPDGVVPVAVTTLSYDDRTFDCVHV